ncbi:MAG TPA: DUF4398 domain-containing protein [Burkholderiaceae bacterium]|nr:DUF4398 domain-containing protein [Burkholderiaceae bacterium]
MQTTNSPPPLSRLTRLAGGTLACAALMACASAPSPAPALAAGAASLEAARAANAGELASVDMNAARQKLERARALAQAGQPREAIRLAEEADVDAQLARARAGSERARVALAEVERGLRTLREELARPPATLPGRTTP